MDPLTFSGACTHNARKNFPVIQRTLLDESKQARQAIACFFNPKVVWYTLA